MRFLDDETVARLTEVSDLPDLSATKYRLVHKLARGGMGTVYLVEDGELGREVALKVLSDPDPSSDLSERLRREAQHLARLEHPNIVPVHDVGSLPDGRVFYAMKFIRGKRLDRWRGGRTLELIWERVLEAAQGAATGTGTSVEWEIIHGNHSMLPNEYLAGLIQAKLEQVGGVTYSSEEHAFAEQLYATLNQPEFSRSHRWQKRRCLLV